MSAFLLKADMHLHNRQVRYVPTADIAILIWKRPPTAVVYSRFWVRSVDSASLVQSSAMRRQYSLARGSLAASAFSRHCALCSRYAAGSFAIVAPTATFSDAIPP